MDSAKVIRTVIVDDARLARDGIRLRLLTEQDFQVIGEAADGLEAVQVIKKLQPDLVFLDVQMPKLDGFEILERVGSTHLPAIVFVTAYDQYATRAFDKGAVDYLLKPLSDARFVEALKRVRGVLKNEQELENALRRLAELLGSRVQMAGVADPAPSAGVYLDRLVVKDRHRFLFVRMEDVNWVQSDENYVILHTQERTYHARVTMSELEARLNPQRFARVHRSVVVNVDRVKEVVASPHDNAEVVLRDGTKLPLGRAYRARLLPSVPRRRSRVGDDPPTT